MINKQNTADQKYNALISAALTLKDAGENDKAIQLFKQAASIDPNKSSAYLLLGLTYQFISDADAAEENFGIALEKEPDNQQALQAFGLFLVAQKRNAEALSYLEKHLKASPDNLDSLKSIGTALEELDGREQRMIAFAARGWEHSKIPEIGAFYGRALVNAEKHQEALTVLQEVVEKERSFDSLTSLAYAFEKIRENEHAIELLKEAVALNSKDALTWWRRSKLNLEIEKEEKALEDIEHAIMLEPREALFWLLKTIILYRLEKFPQIIQSVKIGVNSSINDNEMALGSKRFFIEVLMHTKLERGSS